MNRRSLLKILGLAPLASNVPVPPLANSAPPTLANPHAGFLSRNDLLREFGYKPEEILDHLKYEMERRKIFGLNAAPDDPPIYLPPVTEADSPRPLRSHESNLT